jgi:uncharacterized protein (DUF2147 family)
MELFMKKLLVTTLALAALSASAQMTPVGTWNSVDDETKEVKAEIVIKDNGGVLSGIITKFLRLGADLKAICTKCTDDRKDKQILGMDLIRGAKKTEGKDVWEGGKILDPESGSNYTLRMTPIDGGKKLEIRGSVLFISKTQTWLRVN